MKNAIRPETDSSNRRYAAMRYALVGTICLIASGCVTSPLRTGNQRDHVAEAMGYHPSEVAFMHLCFFEEVQEPDSEKRLKGVRGVIAKTDSEICLMDGAIGMVPTRHFLKIPISEIESVSGSPTQVQIRYQDRLIVLVAFNWDDFRPNSAFTNQIYRSLIAANVPHFESSEHYSWSMLSYPRRSDPNGSQQNSPPTNYEASIQTIRGQQAAKDREAELLFGR